MRKKYNFNAFL